jgi:hypothetical protein
VPPFERNCTSAMTWTKLSSCIRTHGGGAKITSWSPDLRVVNLPDAAVYLYLRQGERWHMIYRPGDQNYRLLENSLISINAKPGRRIELEHVVDMTGRVPAWFRERVVVVWNGEYSQQGVVACTVMYAGRAAETFRGRIEIDASGTLAVVGDRSRTGAQCRNR